MARRDFLPAGSVHDAPASFGRTFARNEVLLQAGTPSRVLQLAIDNLQKITEMLGPTGFLGRWKITPRQNALHVKGDKPLAEAAQQRQLSSPARMHDGCRALVNFTLDLSRLALEYFHFGLP